jgi:hypothetical protein
VKERVPRQTWTSAYSAYNEALKAYNEAFDIASADTLKATLDDFLVLYLKPTITEDLWNRVKVVFDFYRKQANVLDQMIETTMLAEQAKQRKEKEEAMAKKIESSAYTQGRRDHVFERRTERNAQKRDATSIAKNRGGRRLRSGTSTAPCQRQAPRSGATTERGKA